MARSNCRCFLVGFTVRKLHLITVKRSTLSVALKISSVSPVLADAFVVFYTFNSDRVCPVHTV